MLDKQELTETINRAIGETGDGDLFLVGVNVTPDNRVTVEIDAAGGVDIEACVAITQAIRGQFDPEKEDYELEVGSVGLTTPFKVIEQYVKNIGNQVDVLTRDGRKVHGRLIEVNTADMRFTVEVPTKVKEEGMKRPVLTDVQHEFAIADCKSVTYAIDFK